MRQDLHFVPMNCVRARTGRTASNREQRRDEGERGLENLPRHALRKKRSRRDASYLLAGTQGILKL